MSYKNENLNKLNCMNYQVHDAEGDFWYAQNGLESLYAYSKCSDTSFKAICLELLKSGQIVIDDNRDNDNANLCLTMI